jgi:hypothetical protein
MSSLLLSVEGKKAPELNSNPDAIARAETEDKTEIDLTSNNTPNSYSDSYSNSDRVTDEDEDDAVSIYSGTQSPLNSPAQRQTLTTHKTIPHKAKTAYDTKCMISKAE